MIKVLITGGSGFIGTQLTRLLQQKGYHVEHLGRSRNSKAGVKTWIWDPRKGSIEAGALDHGPYEAWYLVHLAGEGIMDKPWTLQRKQSIISSRVNTISFLYSECARTKNFPRAVVSAGGISYYGMNTLEKILEENDAPSNDFIGHCCVEWEKAAQKFGPHCPVSILRTPLVLDRHEGGLPMMDRKILGIRPIVGTGRQWVPWIHVHDLCRAYVHALENGLNGPYNAVAPTHIQYRGFIKEIDRAGTGRSFFIPVKVPTWAVKFLYGERHRLVTEGSRASGQKLAHSGYTFDFSGIKEALSNLYS